LVAGHDEPERDVGEGRHHQAVRDQPGQQVVVVGDVLAGQRAADVRGREQDDEGERQREQEERGAAAAPEGALHVADLAAGEPEVLGQVRGQRERPGERGGGDGHAAASLSVSSRYTSSRLGCWTRKPSRATPRSRAQPVTACVVSTPSAERTSTRPAPSTSTL